MLFKNSSLLALASLGAASVLASPLNRRQETTAAPTAASTTAAVGEVTGVPTSGDSTAVGTSTALTVSGTETTALSSAESAISSAASSAAAAATTTAIAPAEGGEFNGTCPEGYSLTYAISVVEYPDIELEQARNALLNWTTAVPPPIEVTSSEGEGVGATRSWTLTNISVSEVLVNQTENEETGSLIQIWNSTAPITVSPSLIIATAATSLTLFTNTTTNDTSVSFFTNFCASDQQAGLELYSQLITAYLTGLNGLFTNSTASATTTAAEGATTGAASTTAADEATSDAASTTAASSTASGIAGSASSVAGQATSAPASLGSSVAGQVTSGAAGAVSSAVAGVTSGALGGVTSALGAITGGL